MVERRRANPGIDLADAQLPGAPDDRASFRRLCGLPKVMKGRGGRKRLPALEWGGLITETARRPAFFSLVQRNRLLRRRASHG